MVYYLGFHLTTSEVLFMKYSELAAVAADLRTSSPVFAVTPARERALRRLDELFGEADSEYAPAMGRFYRAQSDRALTGSPPTPAQLPVFGNCTVPDSSSNPPGRTLAVDINGGCTPARGALGYFFSEKGGRVIAVSRPREKRSER